jgi:ABC-type transport system involved in cytochrome bd biosynthesis fused ATPase/permease subunit
MCGLLPVVQSCRRVSARLSASGSLLSAGEAQRVRDGSRDARKNTRLVVLDEPFLGLERDRRRALLAHARQRWEGALRCCTHDISETRAFDRVFVMEKGNSSRTAAASPRPNAVDSISPNAATQENVLHRVVARRLEANSSGVGSNCRRSSEGE